MRRKDSPPVIIYARDLRCRRSGRRPKGQPVASVSGNVSADLRSPVEHSLQERAPNLVLALPKALLRVLPRSDVVYKPGITCGRNKAASAGVRQCHCR